ncbi:MAG: hypothetical protein SOU14_05665 [Succiniclasticum sp.]|nr:hypothetical protein [Succiniclasticum sp.]
MRIAKLLSIALVGVLSAALLAGCGNDTASNDKKELVFSKSQGPFS